MIDRPPETVVTKTELQTISPAPERAAPDEPSDTSEQQIASPENEAAIGETSTAPPPPPPAEVLPEEAPVPIHLLQQPKVEPETRTSRELPRSALIGSVAVLVVLVTIGSAILVRASSDPGVVEKPTPQHSPTQDPVARKDNDRPREPRRKERKQRSRAHQREDRGGETVVLAQGPIHNPSATDASAPDPAPANSQETNKDTKPQPPPLPPAPSSYLFHLYNPETGDHFVTVDPGVASEYEGRGYDSAAVGRLYTYAEKGTKAISTNSGTGYIFSSASPKTAPSSSAVALWYASDGAGDFFYTTSKSEASAGGFSASLIGYVRSP
jgi:hypothetical protein